MSNDASPPTEPVKQRMSGLTIFGYLIPAYIFFFAFLIVASVGVTIFMIKFNQNIQLTQEQLEANQERWKAKGPRDYKLIYTKRINDDPKPITFAVTVRDRVVVEVKMNGQSLESDKEHDPLPYHSMDRLMSDAERFLNMDSKSGAKKVYAIARFDDQNTGAMLYYVRRVMGSNERVELDIKLMGLPK